MSHYCCKRCGQRYDMCTCASDKPAAAEKSSPRKKYQNRTPKARRKTDAKKGPIMTMETTAVDVLTDFSGPLFAMRAHIEDLIRKYGPEARIYFDAGHNNVEVMVEHRPAKYGTLKSLPDEALDGLCNLTAGTRYAIREEHDNGTQVLIDTDTPGHTAWVHRERLEAISGTKE